MTTPSPAPNQRTVSLLDRRVPLDSLIARALPWLVVLAVALAVRLYGLRTYPLSPLEATLASDALAIVTGGDLSSGGWTQPLPTSLAALSFFLFGPGDGAARLPSLLAGLSLLVTLPLLARSLGQRATYAAAVLFALSPTLVVASTRLDGAIMLVALAVLAGGILNRNPSSTGALLSGSLIGLLPLCHPLGWPVAVLLTAGSVVRYRHDPVRTVPLVTTIVLTIGLVSTLLFTRPSGLASFVVGSLSTLWRSHLAAFGSDWTWPLVLLATDEVPILLSALAGVVLLLRSGEKRWLVLVFAGALLYALAIGHRSPSALALAVTAAGLLGGFGSAYVAGAVPWKSLLERWNAAALGALAIVVFIALSLIGRLLSGISGNVILWLAGSLSLALLLLAAVWVLRSLWIQATAARKLPLVLLVLALAVLATRNAMLANATTTYRPGSLLHAHDSAPGIVVMVDRIRRASIDLTMSRFDPRDPTGGHGLSIVVSEEIAQPFAWYLRDFPNLELVPSDSLVQAAPRADVVIVSRWDEASVAATRPELVWQPVPYRLLPPAALAEPSRERLALGSIDPRAWRAYISFLLYRRVALPPQPEFVLIGSSREVAALAGFPAVP